MKDNDSDAEEDLHDNRAQEIFKDFILILPLNDRRLLAVILIEFYKRKNIQIC